MTAGVHSPCHPLCEFLLCSRIPEPGRPLARASDSGFVVVSGPEPVDCYRVPRVMFSAPLLVPPLDITTVDIRHQLIVATVLPSLREIDLCAVSPTRALAWAECSGEDLAD
jgi:hypothetical protein